MAFGNLTYTTPWPLNEIKKLLFETCDLQPRQLPVSDILTERQEQVAQLIQDWEIDLETEILAENFYMDKSREHRMTEVQEVLNMAGAIQSKENENETKISTFHSDESHNSGQNCMECHVSGGSGEGWFTVAGTVYDNTLNATYPNALVELYNGPNGTGALITTIEVDALGNFYTTESVDLKEGLYPSVVGNSESTHMAGAITTGQCNKCHGLSTDKIWTR